MDQTNTQQDLVEQFVQELLNSDSFKDMTEETRNQYAPQLVAEAERRIGLAVLPTLDEEGAKEFVRIAENEKTNPEEMVQFLQTHVPDMGGVVQKTLQDFAKEFKKLSEE